MGEDTKRRERWIQTAPERLCRVVLVHGTWPAGFFKRVTGAELAQPAKRRFLPKRPWFQRYSSFRIGLSSKLTLHDLAYVFYPFLWSGHNSVHARDVAARALASLLGEALSAFPNDKFVIVAHSHGGNVALKALNYLGDRAKSVFLITMGTPFLLIRANAHRHRLLSGYSTLLAPFLALFLTGLMQGHQVFDVLVSSLWGNAVLFLGSFAVCEVLIFFLLNPDYFGSKWCKRPTRIADAAFYDLKETPPARLLVLRAFDDEASLSIAAGAVATRMTTALTTKIVPGLVGLIAVAVVGAFALALLFPELGNLFWPIGALPWTTPTTTLMYFGMVVFIVGILPGLFRAVFGRELLVGCARCEISAESVPDVSDRVDVITLSPDPFLDTIRRRHSVYDNESSRTAIADWILKVVEPPRSILPYPEVDGQDWIAVHRHLFGQAQSSSEEA